MAPSQPVYSGPEEFQLSCCLNESKGFRGQLSRSLSERGLRNSWTRIPPPPCFLCGPASFQFSRYSTCKTRRGLQGQRGGKTPKQRTVREGRANSPYASETPFAVSAGGRGCPRLGFFARIPLDHQSIKKAERGFQWRSGTYGFLLGGRGARIFRGFGLFS